MDNAEMFAAAADERRELAELLDTLTADQWRAASLCQSWAVRDVAAHLVMPMVTSIPRFVAAMLAARGNFDKANIGLTARVADRHGDDVAGLLRANAASRFTPPGFGPIAPLTDVIIHGQDIRRPLGLRREIDPERQRAVLDFLVTPAAKRGFTRTMPGIRWKATDLEWSHGDGAEVEGPAEAIMVTLTGRRAALAELSGEGVQHLP
jgi:uncharacterized protein (TIGR03083 family)